MVKTKITILLLFLLMILGLVSCKKDNTPERTEGIGTGNVAPDFTLPDISNNDQSLSDYRGKLVLVQFWASWCSFCRAENPELVTLLDEYKEKGLEILGVSLDTESDNWMNAIEDDHLNFVHLSDLKGFNSPIAETYEVSNIPQMFLVDEYGVIILITSSTSTVAGKVEQYY